MFLRRLHCCFFGPNRLQVVSAASIVYQCLIDEFLHSRLANPTSTQMSKFATQPMSMTRSSTVVMREKAQTKRSMMSLQNAQSRKLLEDYKASVSGKYKSGLAVAGSGNISATSLLAQADDAYADGGYSEVIQLCTQAIDFFNERSARGYLLRADAFRELQNYERAVSEYNQALNTDPMLPEAYLGRGRCYFSLDRHAEAIKEFQKSQCIAEPSVETIVLMGQSYVACGEPTLAVDSFSKAIEMQPDQPGLFFYRAHALQLCGREDEALSDYAHIQEKHPEFMEHYLDEARTAAARDDHAHAVEAFDAVLRLCGAGNPRRAQFLWEKASSQLRLVESGQNSREDVESVVSTLGSVLDHMSMDVTVSEDEIYLTRARLLYQQLGDTRRALAELAPLIAKAESSGSTETGLDIVLLRLDIFVAQFLADVQRQREEVEHANAHKHSEDVTEDQSTPLADDGSAPVSAEETTGSAELISNSPTVTIDQSQLDRIFADVSLAAKIAPADARPHVWAAKTCLAVRNEADASLLDKAAYYFARAFLRGYREFTDDENEWFFHRSAEHLRQALHAEAENHAAVPRLLELTLLAGTSAWSSSVHSQVTSLVEEVKPKREAALQALRDAKNPKNKKKK